MQYKNNKKMLTISYSNKYPYKSSSYHQHQHQVKNLEKKHQELQFKLKEKIMSIHVQIDLMFKLMNDKYKYHQRTLNKYIYPNKYQQRDNHQELNNGDQQLVNLNQFDGFSASSHSSKQQCQQQVKSPRLASTMASQSQSPRSSTPPLVTLTQNHSESVEQSIHQLEQIHTGQSHQLIQQQMKLHNQNQLNGYLGEYQNKIDDLKYALFIKESDIASDHLIRNKEQLPKIDNIKVFNKSHVEGNNIKILCNKIRQIKTQLYQLYPHKADEQTWLPDTNIQQSTQSNKQNNKICEDTNTRDSKIQPSQTTTIHNISNSNIIYDPSYSKIFQLIQLQNTRTTTLTNQYQTISHDYKQLLNQSKILYHEHHLSHRTKQKNIHT